MKKTKQTLVDIIIPTYNKAHYIKDLVVSIKKHVKRDDYQIIVVEDNGPDLQDREELRKLSKTENFIYLEKPENSGFAKTCNVGLQQSKAKFKILLNNDMEAQSDFVTPMVEMLANEQVGIVGARLIYPDGLIQFAGHTRNPYAPRWFDHMFRGQPGNSLVVKQEREIMSCTGACLGISEKTLKKVEEKYGHYGLDERYEMAFEDVDLSFKVRKLGLKIMYAPKAVLVHFEGGTRGVGVEAKNDPKQQRSIKVFWDSWSEEDVDALSQLGY